MPSLHDNDWTSGGNSAYICQTQTQESFDRDMLKAQDSQFKIMEDGRIFYQANPTNPLPGEPFAVLRKGEDILKPDVVLADDSAVLKDQDAEAVRAHARGWVLRHIGNVLEPLAALGDCGAMKPAAQGIAAAVHGALGIVPREQIEDLIVTLDQDDRRDLRAKKVRLGPILVFIPALNKPAAVRLRGLLWGVFHGKNLPMECPKDGIVSFVVDKDNADRAFLQSVGYPVFGSRAIRIDMLDRVISAIYDSAKEGKFQAQHTMAEWLGCSIEGLYEVLEAMGHRKIYDPAQAKAQEAETVVEAADVPAEAPVQSTVEAAVEVVAEAPAESQAPVPAAKPELATFRLKKGKAFEKPAERKERSGEHKKPFAKKPHEKKPFEKKSGAPGDKSKTFRKDKPKPEKRDEPRVISAPSKVAVDSPFAILEQLKKRSDG